MPQICTDPGAETCGEVRAARLANVNDTRSKDPTSFQILNRKSRISGLKNAGWTSYKENRRAIEITTHDVDSWNVRDHLAFGRAEFLNGKEAAEARLTQFVN
jgi:hypothetical protein